MKHVVTQLNLKLSCCLVCGVKLSFNIQCQGQTDWVWPRPITCGISEDVYTWYILGISMYIPVFVCLDLWAGPCCWSQSMRTLVLVIKIGLFHAPPWQLCHWKRTTTKGSSCPGPRTAGPFLPPACGLPFGAPPAAFAAAGWAASSSPKWRRRRRLRRRRRRRCRHRFQQRRQRLRRRRARASFLALSL